MPIKISFLLFLIILIMIFLYLFYPRIENFFVFFPRSEFDFAPQDMGLICEEVEFITEDDITLHGWFFPVDRDSPVILFFHGNAGNISHRLDNINLLLARGLQVFIFDYRGYGRSKGSPSEQGLYKDGRAAYDYLVMEKGISSDRIMCFGRSLGAAVAIDVALKRNIRSIIIESGFTSIKEMARSMFLMSLLSPIIPANYNNLEKIKGINVPKLVIHGDKDELVPFAMGNDLYEAAASPKFFYGVNGAGHNDTYIVGGEKYFKIFEQFARKSTIRQPVGL
ncbi:MAG: alpha/beta hydrolase [Deltaproteobacteria bacterium]|nr:alpha/beta hydrolase [Deltaproteobacteria bacterium]